MEEELNQKGLDSQLWHACAGGMVQMPSINSKVYYFPQGHAEHAATVPDFGPNFRINPLILCRVLFVKYLADTETDEVYARIRLVPISEDYSNNNNNNTTGEDSNHSPPSPPQPENPASFAKTLTQSDANNGGGFSVPRYCAETIFPRLDYSTDPPVQTVLAKDVHGEVWKFRHIYRGTPRRHLLTTGWSTFVNQKKLVAGDAIVFLRSATGELCVGVRRSTRTTSGGDSSAWHLPVTAISPYRTSRWEVKGADNFSAINNANSTGTGFARNRGRVSAKSVIEAARLAASGQSFEVVYYPRASTPEFCVKAQSVNSALRIQWSAGMRFKMAFETEDSSRISWFMGTISSVQFADPLLWPHSPWRLLQAPGSIVQLFASCLFTPYVDETADNCWVTWDEPDLLQNVKRVSPWLVEVVSNMPPIQMAPFTLPKKKLRVTQPPEFQLEGQGIMGIQMATLTNNMLGQISPWHGISPNVPAGMQGARHDRVYGFTLSDFRTNKSQSRLFLDNLYHQEQGVMSSSVSTELNIGNSSQLEHAGVQSSISLTMGNPSQSEQKASNGWAGSSPMKSAPFLLFGKPIHTEQSPKSQQQQQSGLSSSDGPGFQMLNDNGSPGLTSNSSTDGNQEVSDRVQQLITGRTEVCKFFDNSGLQLCQGESLHSAGTNGIGNLQWFKDEAAMARMDKGGNTFEDSIMHCKVFKETEEVGRTLDLSLFCTYEQLYDRLAKMFGIEESELSNRVLYKGMGGSLRHAGDEPYRDFMKTVRRLTILSDSGSDNMAR
eukprot:Gb_33804 [translate_table: standard]